MAIHHVHKYLLDPTHQITVNVIGAGGTGSQVLSNLARMNHALQALDHPGLFVNCFEPDIVTESNIGRQLFAPAEIGMNKGAALITRINRFYGFDWQAIPKAYHSKINSDIKNANIFITCVDTVKARLMVAEEFGNKRTTNRQIPYFDHFYWLDIGNSDKTGQVVLGSRREIRQPQSKEKTVSRLKTVVQLFPEIQKTQDKDTGPSCSVGESLKRQDLFINSTLAQLGTALIWKLFREGRIKQQGAFLNLDTLTVNPINIQ